MNRARSLLIYSATRLASVPIMLWLISTMVFVLLRVAPGDPVDAILGNRADDIARELRPDLIYVGGDIVHCKTQGISPELIDCLSWWFNGLSEICPVHAILGNHDGLQHNKNRQDAISPIISAIKNDRVHLYKNSGTYSTGIPGFNWCVFSCFDEPGWENVDPVRGEVNIALFHGGVLGSITDIDWNIEGEVTTGLFNKFDFTLLGDIHRHQFLNEERTIAYCGSSIQQNYGEDPCQGFLFWYISDKKDFDVSFYEIPHSKPFVTIDWNNSIKETVERAKAYPDGSRFRVRSSHSLTHADSKRLQFDLRRIKNAAEVVFKSESTFDASKIRTSDGQLEKKDL